MTYVVTHMSQNALMFIYPVSPLISVYVALTFFVTSWSWLPIVTSSRTWAWWVMQCTQLPLRFMPCISHIFNYVNIPIIKAFKNVCWQFFWQLVLRVESLQRPLLAAPTGSPKRHSYSKPLYHELWISLTYCYWSWGGLPVLICSGLLYRRISDTVERQAI